MNLVHHVIHKINKDRNSSPESKLSEALPPITNQPSSLITELNNRYREKIVYGKFKPNPTGFASHFNTYCNADSSESFLSFTKTVTELLKGQIFNIGSATGGYLLYAQYEIHNQKFLSVFMVRNTFGFQFAEFDTDKEYFDILNNTHIDVEKLAMACRINIETYNNRLTSTENYLSFVRAKRQETSDYFFNWIEAEELHQNVEYTKMLCEIFKTIELPVKLGDIENPDRETVQRKVYEYCTNLPQMQLDLINLSKEIYGEINSNKIIDFADEHNIQISTTFTPNKSKLGLLYKLSVQDKDITLKFDYSSLKNDTIRLDGNLVIIDSASLVNKIRRETGNGNTEDSATI